MRWLVLLFLASAAWAGAPTVQDAQSLMQRSDFAGAAKILDSITRNEPGNGQAWFLLGYCYHASKDLDRAITAHTKAAGFPAVRATASYNLACAYALKQDQGNAILWTQRAIQAGFKNLKSFRSDPDLASLQGVPAFEKLLPPPLHPPASGPGNPREFDFWIGEWQTRNRSLDPSGRWTDSGSLQVKVFPILDGNALVEYSAGSGMLGFSVRAFDPKTNLWTLVLNWPSLNRPLFSTMQGRFRHGRGEFLSEWTDQAGKSNRLRYTFSDVAAKRLRWDSALSQDHGRTWKTNMMFLFTRRPETATALTVGPSQSNQRCPQAVFRGFDFLLGSWVGRRSDDDVRLEVTSIMEGAAVVSFLETGAGYKSFAIRAYDPRVKQWVRYRIDNRSPVFERLQGSRPQDLRNPGTRVEWTDLGDGRWEWRRSTSPDGGRTWQAAATTLERKRN